MEKVSFLLGRKQFHAVNEYDLLAQSSLTSKLLQLWKKTVYSGIELIWEFPKQCLAITKTYFWYFVIAPFDCIGEFAKVFE